MKRFCALLNLSVDCVVKGVFYAYAYIYIYIVNVSYSILYVYQFSHIYPPLLEAAASAVFMVWLQACKRLFYFHTTLHFYEFSFDMLEN
jgi:hypothetical protein